MAMTKMVSLNPPASSALRGSSPFFFNGLLPFASSISRSSPQTTKVISLKASFQAKGPPNSPRGIGSVNGVNLKLRMGVMSQARRGFLSELRKMKEEEDFASELQYELPLKIVKYPDSRLRAKNKPINIFDEKLQRLADEMFDLMYKTDGVGLSAPQVGVNVQLMVFNPAGESGKGEEVILVNPEIYKYSKRKEVFTEGCLSFPEIYADVERPMSVKIEAWDVKGKKFILSLKEFNARIFQHEYDHLQRILFFERMHPDILETIRPALQDLEQKYEIRTGMPAPERVKGHI
jgi:peptide deformylase|uniref:Peptide deformylase n=1 Tax=Picea sitchensis TaxID=3332 RepID=A9NUU5_PICSI|nr:unknown [Picea sitchensis]